MHLLLPSRPSSDFCSFKAWRRGFASSGDDVSVEVACQLGAVVRERAARRQNNSLRSLSPSRGSTPLSKHLEEDAAYRRPLLGLTPDVAMNVKTILLCVVRYHHSSDSKVGYRRYSPQYVIDTRVHPARPFQPY